MPALRPRIVFSIGDVNGIGIEVLSRALADPHVCDSIEPVVVCNVRLVREYLAAIPALPREPLLACELIDIESDAVLAIGRVDAAAGKLAHDAIVSATELVARGAADALVTMPVSKAGMHEAGCDFPGHTELIASIVGGVPMMILLTEGMLVALATVHVPIARVSGMLTQDLITSRLAQLTASLREDFAIAHPRIAVLAANPHAGEDGLIGREEIDVISPAVASMRGSDADIDGPLAADGFFARYEVGEFDGILAMYHDQGLIPLKLFAHGGGVNFTASLSIVRTSPDHGTAYNIAGKSIANERSVIEAIRVAVRVAGNRRIK